MTTEFDTLRDFSTDLMRMHAMRVARILKYEDMYRMKWDFVPPEGDWVQKLPSPDPHNAVKGLTRLMIASEPYIKAVTDSPDVAFAEEAEAICKTLLRLQNRRGPYMTDYDIAMSSILAGEAYVRVTNVEENIKFLRKRGQDGTARRYEQLKWQKPFLFQVMNPRSVFPLYGDLGLEAIVTRTLRTRKSLEAFWGQTLSYGGAKTHKIAYLDETGAAVGTIDTVAFMTYDDHNERAVWIEGVTKPILHVDNTKSFIPFAGSIVEGTSLFDTEEDRRLPLLYPVLASGYWHAQSYADSIMWSLALAIGKLPQLLAKLNDPEQKIHVDWGTLLGVMKVSVNEDIKFMDKKVIDDSLQVAKNISDSKMVEMTVPKQVFGSAPDRVLAFAALNLLVQAGRLPAVPIQRMAGIIMGRMFEIPFQWAKDTGETYPIPNAEYEGLAIDPSRYENIRIEANMRPSFAQDDPQRVATAANAIAGGFWSVERGMEYTGVDDTRRERAKIEDDVQRNAKLGAAAQAMSQQYLQIAQSAESIGNTQLSPQQVEYRPGEDTWRLCGNCRFFRGPGVPCAIVATPIDPTYTCNEWGPLGPAPAKGAPTMESPLVTGGGGLPTAARVPQATRESISGRDVGGLPVTGGTELPLRGTP